MKFEEFKKLTPEERTILEQTEKSHEDKAVFEELKKQFELEMEQEVEDFKNEDQKIDQIVESVGLGNTETVNDIKDELQLTDELKKLNEEADQIKKGPFKMLADKLKDNTDKIKKYGKYAVLAGGLSFGAYEAGKPLVKEVIEYSKINRDSFEEIMSRGTEPINLLRDVHDPNIINPTVARKVADAALDSIFNANLGNNYVASVILHELEYFELDERYLDSVRLEKIYRASLRGRWSGMVFYTKLLRYSGNNEEILSEILEIVNENNSQLDFLESEVENIRFSKNFGTHILDLMTGLKEQNKIYEIGNHLDLWIDQPYAKDFIALIKGTSADVFTNVVINNNANNLIKYGFQEEIINNIITQKSLPKFDSAYIPDTRMLGVIKEQVALWVSQNDELIMDNLLFDKPTLLVAGVGQSLVDTIIMRNIKSSPWNTIDIIYGSENDSPRIFDDVDISKELHEKIYSEMIKDPDFFEDIADYPLFINKLGNRDEILEKIIKDFPFDFIKNWKFYSDKRALINKVALELSHDPEYLDMRLDNRLHSSIYFWNRDNIDKNIYSTILDNRNISVPLPILDVLSDELSDKEIAQLVSESVKRNPEEIVIFLMNDKYRGILNSFSKSNTDFKNLPLLRSTFNTIDNDNSMDSDSKEEVKELLAQMLPVLDDVLKNIDVHKDIESYKAGPYIRDQFYKISYEYPEFGTISNREFLKKTVLQEIQTINTLHDRPDAIRFNSIDHATPSDLYTMLTLGEEEVFTSTFNGMFNRMLDRMNASNISTYTFLEKAKFADLHIFIRECASYDRLDDLLNNMSSVERAEILNRFINSVNVESGDMKEAVSVADVFSLIEDPVILDVFRKAVEKKYKEGVESDNIKIATAYGLLGSILESHAPSNNRSLQQMNKKFKLTSLEKVTNKSLESANQEIAERVYFYNDEDGMGSFESFTKTYLGKKNWTITNKGSYIMIQSTGQEKVSIYANKPQDEEKGNFVLDSLFEKNGIDPKVVIHRGHSYHAKNTIYELHKTAKFVFMGSCGGYNNLASILHIAPDAQIFSTKGTGTMQVNDPLLHKINQELAEGNDLIWEDIAKKMQTLESDDRFKNYVFPNKNLGLVYLKSYSDIILKKK